MPVEFVEADVKREAAALRELLGDTRRRFYQRKTQIASTDRLIDLDMEIRDALARPASADLQLQLRLLTARLRALDPQ